MAKRGIDEAIDCEFELPEHIIQHIQSYLTGKEAAQTAVLSKSWHKAWLTRPNIDFDCEDFLNSDGLLELSNKTIQRYEESNLKIESFRLRLYWLENYNSDIVNTLILKALKLCAHLSFGIKQRNCGEFVIAREVFEIENLLGLSLEGCGIDIGMDHTVRCSKLQSLSLNSVEMQSRGMISKIISSCPLIENLSLSYIFEKEGFTLYDPINLPKMHNLKRLVLSGVELDTLFFRDMSSKFPSLKDLTLKKLSVGECTFDVGMDQNVSCSRLQSLSLDSVEIKSRDMISEIILSCPLIENMSLSEIRDEQYYQRPVISGPISLPKLHNIKCLVLCFVHFDTFFLCDLSYKFPFLKDLTLNGFWRGDEEVEEIQISSHSLEHLNLATDHRGVRFEFDVPSIRKLTFECGFVPLVSFKSTSSEWESHVSIHYSNDRLDTSWFLPLNELLTALIPSKIYLTINGMFKTWFSYEVGDIQGLPQAEVENLTLDIRHLPTLNCYVLFDGIFRACRPKFITQYLLSDSYLVGKTNSDFLCKRLAQGVDGEFSSPRNFMYGLNGLKEVNVQVFDEFVAVWKDHLPCKSLLEASESLEEKKIIRFQLVWKP